MSLTPFTNVQTSSSLDQVVGQHAKLHSSRLATGMLGLIAHKITLYDIPAKKTLEEKN